MIFNKGKIRFRQGHWSRLKEGLKQLRISNNNLTSIVALERFLREQFGGAPLRIRWNVYRDGLGKYTPQNHEARELILIQKATTPPKVKETAYFSTEITVPKSPWSHCKTLNALTYVMANIERHERGMDEVILKDSSGYISESGIANLFWKKEDAFYTPSLNCSCIAGVARGALLKHLNQQGISVLEGKFSEADLLSAQQVFTTNVSGIAYLQHIENTEFDTSPIELAESLFN
ncbi:aminodeoxychorismate lyase [Echinicola strongylocentroti]|uniref:branched-chain-amino-acid transaminase n=1 Tax=Echinicola strongylocentroti TaxID=1795355 RepID=A0A2Z4IQ17_9BACT|nr:aminotransferase class IV [Echinicola strongylocentroti]AWW33271.1 aminodeoxychorismate lyase [Echinicola strongylocentroti]